MRGVLPGSLVLALGAICAEGAHAQCPAVGADTGCGSLITVTQTGATVIQTGQGPYVGSDDTLIGVVNNSTLPIYSLDLASVNDIFGFDGDGIDTYGVAGNSQDNTGYGGPNAYFTNDTTSLAGRVNFITPIAPNGGTAFFSLENVLTAGQGCTSLLNNAVPKPAGGGTTITTTFIPQGTDPSTGSPYTLASAAQVCGFIGWDWQQTITTLPLPLPGNSFNAIATPATPPVTPFNDPPPSGYNYMLPVPPGPLDAPQLPVYWDPFNGPYDSGFALSANETATQLTFFDGPADPCLPGAQDAATTALGDSACGGVGVRAPAGSTINFTTHLVGLQGALPGAAVVDTGIGFDWNSNFNGTNGHIAVLPSFTPTDPGSGTGGITVTGYTALTSYNGVAVTAINGVANPFAPSPLLAAVLPESRSVQIGATATAFATIINTSTVAGTGCTIAPAGTPPLTFHFQTTDPTTNQVTGTLDAPVTIAAGGQQTFVVGLTPTAAISPNDMGMNFTCSNTTPAPIKTGLNTLLISSAATPTADVVAVAGTMSRDGILHLPGAAGSSSFVVATINLGAGSAITATVDLGGATLPVTVSICQTNPTTGVCISPPSSLTQVQDNPNNTPTFGIFATATGAIPLDPANSRIFVEFTDSSGAMRGKTSVALETQ